jgi:Mg2+ and Co2+ transporter CorA
VAQTFNLIAIKESQAVERLTRTTILLAKLTILFLPVSLMTGYFSVQISDLQGVYTYKTYWGCFAVIMFLSIMLLFVFGWISGAVEGKATYQSLTENLWTKSKKLAGKGR